MAEWSLNIDDWVKGTTKKVNNVKRAFAFAAYASIVEKTPVGNPDFDPASGRARGNWNVSVGKPDLSTSDRREPKFKLFNFPKTKGDEPIYISNNLPYIHALEFGEYPNPPKKGSHTRKGVKPARWEKLSEGGFSKQLRGQTPQGMVGLTVANREKLIKAALQVADRIGEE